jgi:hypothetical protein
MYILYYCIVIRCITPNNYITEPIYITGYQESKSKITGDDRMYCIVNMEAILRKK